MLHAVTQFADPRMFFCDLKAEAGGGGGGGGGGGEGGQTGGRTALCNKTKKINFKTQIIWTELRLCRLATN